MALQDIVKKGSTDRSVPIYAFDNTTGLPKADLAYNSSGVDLWYRREGAAVVSITEATLASLTTAHTDGGFIAVANGEYRLDLPDAAFASGANYVDYGGTFTGYTLVGGRVKLVGVDLEDAVRGGMTALPNAAADAAGGLPISDAGGLDMDAALAKLTGALTEAYRADGATGTFTQLLYEIVAHLGESSISGTTKTTKRIDGTTTAATYTLNDATTPTSITRAT